MKAVIFDIGGVFVRLDYARTKQSFCELGAVAFDNNYRKLVTSDDFYRFETGHLSTAEFRHQLRSTLQLAAEIDDNAVDNAWNSMLVDLPSERLAILKDVKALGFAIYCFSNNNAIHSQFIKQHFTQQWQTLMQYCQRCVLSHEVGYRKPSPASFKQLLADICVTPNHAYFVDDKSCYVDGAHTAGIHAFHLSLPTMSLKDDFMPWLIKKNARSLPA